MTAAPGWPPYRVVTPRLVIRCWEPRDAPALKAAIDESLEHLRPWMPWAHQEPESLAAKVERLRQFRARFDRGDDLAFGLFDREERAVLGAIGLHARVGAGAREIGYWIGRGHIRRGYASEAAAALTRCAFDIARMRRIEIHCDPINHASAGVPRRLGYTHALTIASRAAALDSIPRDTMIWVLTRDTYASSSAAGSPIEAFGPAGQRLP